MIQWFTDHINRKAFLSFRENGAVHVHYIQLQELVSFGSIQSIKLDTNLLFLSCEPMRRNDIENRIVVYYY